MNLSKLSMRDFRLLLSLFETGSLTAAARHICVSTPVASRMLADMRHDFGDPLFVRSSQGMMPTTSVMRMIPTVRQIVSLSEKLTSADNFDPQTHQGIVRIAMLDHVMLSHLTRQFVYRLHELAPRTKLEFRLIDQALDQKLANGEIDMAVWPTEQFGPNYHSKPLHRSACYLAVRKGHPLAQLQAKLPPKAYVPVEEIVKFPKIVCAYRKAVETHFFDFEAQQETFCWVPMYASAGYWVAGSDATFSVPNAVLHDTFEQFNTTQVRVDPRHCIFPATDIKLVWHDRVHHDPMQKWVRGLFLQIFRKEADLKSLSPMHEDASV